LRRGLSPEAAASRAIAKFPSGVSALCLLHHKGVPVMLALRRLDPIWLSDNGSSVALIGAPAPPLPIWRSMHPIESGDIAIVEPFQISIVDAEGMRMERHAPRLHNAELAAIAIN
jgi:hypothetical protein